MEKWPFPSAIGQLSMIACVLVETGFGRYTFFIFLYNDNKNGEEREKRDRTSTTQVSDESHSEKGASGCRQGGKEGGGEGFFFL